MDRDIVTDYDNLYRAYRKAKSGKKFNSSTAKFSSMALDGINILKEQLENQTYTVAPYNRFEIFEPKQRVIESCTFKDKVVQHVFCDNILHPKLQNVFVKYNSAGQVGKGTLYALNGLKDHMEAFYEKHGLDHVLIDSSENPGLPLGNQAGQVYALLMVHPVDCMITGELGIVEYGRYMDDFYLFHQNKEYLKWCLDCIRELLESLGLELNGKTQIIPFRKGIRFLGFHHYMTADGKYIRKITGENKRKIKKRLNKWVKEVKNGKMEKSKMEEKFSSWKNHALHGNCIKLVHSMDLYVEKLFKEQ